MSDKILIIQKSFPKYRDELWVLIKNSNNIIFAGCGFEEQGMRISENLIFNKLNYKSFLGGKIFTIQNWKKIFLENNIISVIVTPTPRNLSLFNVLNYCKKNNITTIGYSMGPMPNKNFSQKLFHNLFTRALIRNIDKIITYSSSAFDFYKYQLNYKGKLIIGHNAFTSLFDTQEERQIYFLNKKKKLQKIKKIKIGVVGRLTKNKGLEKLIYFLRKNEFEFDIEFHFFGDGPLKKIFTERNSNYKFHGFKTPEELKNILFEFNAVLVPGLGGLTFQLANELGLGIIFFLGDGTEYDRAISGFSAFKISSFSDLNDLRNIDLSKLCEGSFQIGSSLGLKYLANKINESL